MPTPAIAPSVWQLQRLTAPHNSKDLVLQRLLKHKVHHAEGACSRLMRLNLGPLYDWCGTFCWNNLCTGASAKQGNSPFTPPPPQSTPLPHTLISLPTKESAGVLRPPPPPIGTGLCGDPRGVGLSYKRGTPVLLAAPCLPLPTRAVRKHLSQYFCDVSSSSSALVGLADCFQVDNQGSRYKIRQLWSEQEPGLTILAGQDHDQNYRGTSPIRKRPPP